MGGASLLVDVLLFTPILLSNVPLALMIVLLAFAYLGDDVLLCIALLIIVGLLIAAGMIWQSMSAAGWVRAVLDRTCRRAPATLAQVLDRNQSAKTALSWRTVGAPS